MGSKAENGATTFSMANAVPDSKEGYSTRSSSPDHYAEKTSLDPANPYSGDRDNLISNAAPIGQDPPLQDNGYGGYGGGGGGGDGGYYQQSGGYSNQGGYATYRS